MENIKLVLCDIDGTLLNSQQTVSPKTKKALCHLKEKHILLGIATGRSPYSITRLMSEWGLENHIDYIIGLNGANILDINHQELINTCLLEGQYIQEILEDFKEFDKNIGIFDGPSFHVLEDREQASNIAKGDRLELVIDDLTIYHQKSIGKIMFMAKPEIIDQMDEKYQNKIHSQHYRAVRSTPDLLEFMNPALSKLKGIETICHQLKITKENVLVFGDELNDLEMIEGCVGVAMGNANPKIKAIAQYTTKSNDENGIGYFLEKYIL